MVVHYKQSIFVQIKNSISNKMFYQEKAIKWETLSINVQVVIIFTSQNFIQMPINQTTVVMFFFFCITLFEVHFSDDSVMNDSRIINNFNNIFTFFTGRRMQTNHL